MLRIVLVTLLIYSLVSLSTVGWQLRKSERLLGELEEERNIQESLNAQLQSKLAQGQSPEELQQLARERLGLVLPGEKLFYFSSDREG